MDPTPGLVDVEKIEDPMLREHARTMQEAFFKQQALQAHQDDIEAWLDAETAHHEAVGNL